MNFSGWLVREPGKDANSLLGQGTQKGRRGSEGAASCVPCFRKLRKSFQLTKFARTLGLRPFNGWGCFFLTGWPLTMLKGKEVSTDTQETPERLITQPVSFPLPALLEHLQRVFKFNLQTLTFFLCSTGLFLFRAFTCTFHLPNAKSHNGQ